MDSENKNITDMWFEHAHFAYERIMNEMESVPNEHISQAYPKFVVMYTYFCFLRGEAFIPQRGDIGVEAQKNLYEMEDALHQKLEDIKNRLDPHDSGTNFYINEMKKHFDV